MSTKLFLIALTAFFSLSQFANAGVMLYVHFGDNAPSVVNGVNELQTTFNPGANNVTANIYLKLTDQSRIYGYRFSVRYNAAALGLNLSTTDFQTLQDNVRQDLRDAVNPGLFIEEFANTDKFGPPDSLSTIVDPLTDNSFLEIRRFNGNMPGFFTDERFLKVASLTFDVINPGLVTPGTQLVRPGIYDLIPAGPLFPNDVLLDTFGGVDLNGDDITLDFLGAFGGNVTPISSVPEPTSVVVFGALGVLAFVFRKSQAKSMLN